MTDQESALNYDDLLCLAEVGNIAHIIDASSVITGASSVPHSAGNQRDLSIDPVELSGRLGEIALDQGSEPSTIDLLPDEVAIQGPIPEVLMVASDQLKRVSALLLHPGEAPLSGSSQIVAVGEVEAVFKVTFNIVDHLLRCLCITQLNFEETSVK